MCIFLNVSSLSNGIIEIVLYPWYRLHISSYLFLFISLPLCLLSFFPSIFLLHSFPSTCPRLFGMTGVIRTNSSDPHSLGLHSHVSWPDFINPLVLLLLYYTLVALLHKWVHITEEVCVSVFMCVSEELCCVTKGLHRIFYTYMGCHYSTAVYDICHVYYITTYVAEI